ncbi:MAG TPA: putative toxin-antitoxin system toxin component, PIN family [Opitutaceae bacterium]|nr:putative toxin-antitoxin system toxin component, PIN family [Opitutaceae bacterium]
MKEWVIDTNVVVSGLLTPGGNAARILDAVTEGQIRLAYDARILAEYRDVLRRPKLKIQPVRVEAFLDGLRSQALVSPRHIEISGPDPDDLIFIEAALATATPTIITGNLSDFSAKILGGARVLTPAEAAKLLSAKAS